MKHLTPQQAIRKFCIQCVGGSPGEVRNCGGNNTLGDHGNKGNQCWFYPYRLGRGNGKPSLKTIRMNCLECMGGSYKLVRECPAKDCPVYEYRFGKRINKKF